jgi:hypothetical protein
MKIKPEEALLLAGLLSLSTIARSRKRTEALSKCLLTLSFAEKVRAVRPIERADWAHLDYSIADRRQIEVAFHNTVQLLDT